MEAIWNANPTVNMMFCFEDGNCFIKHTEAASYAKETGKPYIVKMREEVTQVKEVAEVVKQEEEIKEVKPTTKNKK